MTVRCGIVGGMGPESTLDYYKLMVEHYRDGQDTGYPELTIDIVDLKPILRFLEAGNRKGLADYMLDSIDRLVRAGCTFAALTSNTSHVVFPEVAARSPIPLISIVEAASDHATVMGLRDKSKEVIQAKPADIMDVNDDAVREALRRHGVAPCPRPYAPAGKAHARRRWTTLRAVGAARLVRSRRLPRTGPRTALGRHSRRWTCV